MERRGGGEIAKNRRMRKKKAPKCDPLFLRGPPGSRNKRIYVFGTIGMNSNKWIMWKWEYVFVQNLDYFQKDKGKGEKITGRLERGWNNHEYHERTFLWRKTEVSIFGEELRSGREGTELINSVIVEMREEWAVERDTGIGKEMWSDRMWNRWRLFQEG